MTPGLASLPLIVRRLLALRLYRVRGSSMTPTLEHGDLLVVDTREETEPRIGDVVVLDTQKKGERRVIVKRVSSRGRQTWAVSSDNPLEGQDSRQLGSFERDDIIGRVELSLSNKRPPRIHRSRR